jgi:hypothetical protein
LIDTELPPAHANVGFARRAAMEIAALWLEQQRTLNGVVLTTDADTRVPSHWIAQNLESIRNGCDAVAGRVKFDPAEEAELPQLLRERTVRENAYQEALLALSAIIDPIAHDPWPNHWAASGASFGVTLRAYRSIGGLPYVTAGEDRSLADALMRRGIAIRHDCGIEVTTSARLIGRASGGCAETLRTRCTQPNVPGDPALEPFPNALRRYVWRRRLRRRHRRGSLLHDRSWHTALALPPAVLECASERWFGAFWAAVEQTSILLKAAPLRPDQLQSHMAMARASLAALGQQKTVSGAPTWGRNCRGFT